MKGSENLSKYLIFSLRNILLLITTFSWFLIVKESLDLPFAIAAYAASIFLAFIFEKNNFRFLSSLILLMSTAAILRWIIFLVFLVASRDGKYNVDMQYIFFDVNLLAVIPPCIFLWINNFFSLRHNKYKVFEIFINIPSFIVVFTFLSKQNLNIFKNPSTVIVIIGFVLFLNTILLFIYTREKNLFSSRTQYFSFLLSVIPIALVSFFFFYDFYEEKAKKTSESLVHSGIAGIDFANFSELSPELKQNTDLIFIIKADNFKNGTLYKRYIFPRYERGKGFFIRESDKDFLEPLYITQPLIQNKSRAQYLTMQETFSDTIYSVNLKKNSIVSAGCFKTIELLELNSYSNFNYAFNSYYNETTANKSHTSTIIEIPSDQLSIYLEHDDKGRIRTLTEEITNSSTNIYHKAEAISTYLQKNYYYSLRPGIVGKDAIEKFLFDEKKGYCSYFANSMAIMCRTIGIPTRVIAGFKLEETEEIMNLRPVYGYMAHSWVEVYVPESGWVTFDPTSDQLHPSENYTFSPVDSQEFKKLAGLVLQEQFQINSETDRQDQSDQQQDGFKIWYWFLPFLYILIITTTKHMYLLLSLIVRNLRKKTLLKFRHVKYILSNLGIYEKTTETETEYLIYVSNILNVDLRKLDSLHQKALYSREFTSSDYKEFISEAKNFRKVIRKKYKPLYRIFGILKPFGFIKRGRR
ncbi:MAG: transglutaminase domain-containing protein [Spirochaetales bacterium]|nr:transglutaminase domain-containing protein [Spirochaetales bacterium]